MTGHLRAGIQAQQVRGFSDTALIGVEAAAVEHAAGGKVDGGGDLAF